MSEVKHTPGPFTLTSDSDGTRHSIGATLPCINGLSARFEIAVVYAPSAAEEGYTDGALTPSVALANATLFAAAPELLEVVECMAKFDGRNNNAALKEMARAALAKAKGAA